MYTTTGRYILAPRSGLRSARDPAARAALLGVYAESGDLTQPKLASYSTMGNAPMTVLDSTNEDGVKLVQAEPEVVDAVNASTGPLRLLPEVIYDAPIEPLTAIPSAAATNVINVNCRSAANGKPLPGQSVVAFSNYAARLGANGVTDANGVAKLNFSGAMIEKLFVLPAAGWWGAYRANLPAASLTVDVEPVTVHSVDVIRGYYPTRGFLPGTGVTVGVLDTGCGPHTDLNIVSGRCTVTGQPPTAFQDIDLHGTHVAGLIGGTGAMGTALLGLAPGVNIRAYRVFQRYGGDLGASNYAILKAMIIAALENCDIINLSLGGGPHDPIVEEAILDARDQGMLTVVAAGNGGRAAVSYPAAYTGAFAVSAMGDETYLPTGCYDRGNIARPPPSSVNPTEFLASFSNVGPQIAVTGLGVGVTSTLPNNLIGIMSGTSMAAPMIAGATAAMLSKNLAIFGMARTPARATAIADLVRLSCVPRFSNQIFDGYGLPRPSAV